MGILIEHGYPNNVTIKDNEITNLNRGVQTNVFQYGTNNITNNTMNNCKSGVSINLDFLKSYLNTDLSKGGTELGLPSFRDDLPHCVINVNNNYFNDCEMDVSTIVFSKCNEDLTKYNSGSIVNIYDNHLNNTNAFSDNLHGNEITNINHNKAVKTNENNNRTKKKFLFW